MQPDPLTAPGSITTTTEKPNFPSLTNQVQSQILNTPTTANNDKVKVISWNVSLKKGQKISLGYTFKAPQVSPQFYLLGPLRFYNTSATGSGKPVFQETRQWQIAADAVGVPWYDYNWQYRKQITIDHTKVGMPPPLDATSIAHNTSVSSLTWSHTTTTNSNTILLVGVSTSSPIQTVSSITYNGVSLSIVPTATQTCPTSSCHSELWYLIAPSSGAHNIIVTLSGSAGGVVGGAASYYNVNQTTPLGTAAVNNGSGATGSVTVNNTSTNQVVVDSFTAGGASAQYNKDASQTQLWLDNSFQQGSGSYKTGGSSTTTMQWTNGGTGNWADVAVPINPVPILQNDPSTAVTFMEPGTDATQDFSFYNFSGCTSSNIVANTGPRSIRCDNGNFVQKKGILSDTGRRISAYLYVNSFPTTTEGIIETDTSAPAQIYRINLNTSHKLASNNSAAVGTTVLQTGQWYRITLSYTVTSGTVNSFKVYLNGNLEYTDTNLTVNTGSDTLSVGRFTGTGGAAFFYYDDIYVDNGNDLSDPGPINVTAKLPNVDNVHQFTTPIGANPGAGSRFTNINERPLSTTNGWSINVANQRENYGIQGASTGDVDISAKTLIANAVWVFAKTGVACTGNITNNGNDTPISLTTSDAMYTNIVKSASYPGNAATVGIQSCTSTQLVSLEETGMLVAYYNPAGNWCNAVSSVTCNTNWQSRIKITFNNSASGTNLVNFPVLVVLNSGRINYNKTKAAGQDIRFVDPSDNTTVLPHEIESWNSAGNSYIWVKVPQINAASNSDFIYMYYNNAAASDGQQATSVWDSNYLSVQHLAETSGTSAPDSTSNANNGTKVSATSPNPTSSGQIDGAESFNGTSDFITEHNGYANFTTGLTLDIWAFPTVANGYQRFFDIGNGSAQQNILLYRNNGTTNLTFEMYVNGVGSTGQITATGAIALNQWQHFVVTLDASKNVTIYKNGVSIATGTQTALPDNLTRSSNFLGKSNFGDPLYQGTMDEARISNIPRSADWVKAEYLTGLDTFNTYGSEETQFSAFPVSNFPVLINLSSDPDLAANAQNPSGNDIFFTDSTGQVKLNHEIESYTAGTGALVAWVNVPTLSASTDTILYMYYGNAKAANQQNATGVWNSNYLAVYHSKETSGTVLNDSTSNAVNGTKVSAILPNPISGQIDGAQDYNGTTACVDLGAGKFETGGNQITVSAWVKFTDALGTDHAIVRKQAGSSPLSGEKVREG